MQTAKLLDEGGLHLLHVDGFFEFDDSDRTQYAYIHHTGRVPAGLEPRSQAGFDRLDALAPWRAFKQVEARMGSLGEMFNLEELAADCAADGVYQFLLTAPPLQVTGGIGSPINPLAVK